MDDELAVHQLRVCARSRVGAKSPQAGDGRDRRDNIEAAVGGGSGLMIGALAGGLKGGLIGAGIGATASTVYWLVQHRSGALPAGTELQMELSRPLAVTLAPAVAANGAE